nr:hypothetical protein [Tanacetum cinerariifolium]
MLEKHQLTGPKFNEWFHALKLVVHTEKLHDVFETALPHVSVVGADAQALADWGVLFYRYNEVACLMLGTMYPKLYQQFKHNSPLEMEAEGQSVSDHVLLMKSYLDQLATLNYAFPDKVSISFILNSLSSEFQAFVQNYNMPLIEKTISRVHSLLIKFEKSIKRNKQPIIGASPTPQVRAIQVGRVQKYKPQGKAKGKGKGKDPQNSYPTKPRKPQPYKKERSTKDGQCHHCKEDIGKGTVLSATHILNMVPTKKVDKTPYELWHGKVPNLSYLKESRRIIELEDEDILPSENTSEHPIKEESLALIISQEEDVIHVRRSVRTHKAPDRLSLSDPEFEKWLVVMNTKMQSMYDNKVWRLVVLPPNAIVVKSKWIYKKKTDMDCKNSGEAHWTAVKSILKYLRNTKDMFLVYGGDPEAKLRVNCYYDVRFETDRDDMKSQTSYIAASEAAKEAVWIRKFIDELGVVPSNDYPIKMNCDNPAAIIMAKESGI